MKPRPLCADVGAQGGRARPAAEMPAAHSLAAAPHCGRAVAVDMSSVMLEILNAKPLQLGVENVSQRRPRTRLNNAIAPGVSSYCGATTVRV